MEARFIVILDFTGILHRRTSWRIPVKSKITMKRASQRKERRTIDPTLLQDHKSRASSLECNPTESQMISLRTPHQQSKCTHPPSCGRNLGSVCNLWGKTRWIINTCVKRKKEITEGIYQFHSMECTKSESCPPPTKFSSSRWMPHNRRWTRTRGENHITIRDSSLRSGF